MNKQKAPLWDRIVANDGMIINRNDFPVRIHTRHDVEITLYEHESYDIERNLGDSRLYYDILIGNFRAYRWDGLYI